MPPRKALPAPSQSSQKSLITTKNKNKNNKLLGCGKSLQTALILQKQKILAKNKDKKRICNKSDDRKINIKSTRSAFQEELLLKVQNPQLRESWHILKSRKVEDPHAKAVMKFCRDLMITKSSLKRVPAPDCKTIIVLD